MIEFQIHQGNVETLLFNSLMKYARQQKLHSVSQKTISDTIHTVSSCLISEGLGIWPKYSYDAQELSQLEESQRRREAFFVVKNLTA